MCITLCDYVTYFLLQYNIFGSIYLHFDIYFFNIAYVGFVDHYATN